MPPKISLASARVNAGLSQAEAAKLIGVGQDTLSGYETGKVSPKWEVIEKMSQVYNYPIDFLRIQ